MCSPTQHAASADVAYRCPLPLALTHFLSHSLAFTRGLWTSFHFLRSFGCISSPVFSFLPQPFLKLFLIRNYISWVRYSSCSGFTLESHSRTCHVMYNIQRSVWSCLLLVVVENESLSSEVKSKFWNWWNNLLSKSYSGSSSQSESWIFSGCGIDLRKFHWKLGSSPFLYKPVAVFQFVTLALWSAFHFISLSAP